MRVHSVTVCPDRVDVVVKVEDAAEMRTSLDAEIADRALRVLPGLADHQCSTRSDRTFGEELSDTEVPHLFEHVVLELMAEAGSPRNLKGETAWDFRHAGDGVFRVSVEYDDDLVCLGAIKTADKLMCYLLGEGEAPDVEAATEQLVSLRGWPANRPA